MSQHQLGLGRVLAAMAVCVSAAVVPLHAAAQERPAGGDPLEALEANRQRQAELLASLDTLAATEAELNAAIDSLNASIGAQEAAVAETQQQLALATYALEQAEQALEDKTVELAELQRQLEEMVVEAFMHPPSNDALSALISSRTPNEAEAKTVMRDTKVAFDVDLVEEVDRVRLELDAIATEARETEAEVARLHEQNVAQLEELSLSRAQHQTLATAVRERVEIEFAEAAAIADQNAELAGELSERARRLAERIGGRAGGVDLPLVKVGVFRVHELIAPQLALLLDAASADGIELGGGAYRTTEQQIALRRAHCGEDRVFTAPASSCSPPTAKPGTSMHEIGMAIDFEFEGSIISSRQSPAFVWLDEHAPTYGLFNLPSEPWHWSINGD